MNILILENNPERIKVFKKAYANHNTTYTDIAKAAIELLKKIKYDLIFLDHDLGDIIYENPHNEGTGYQVAKVIPHTINSDTKVIIHSLNVYGAELMQKVIGETAIYIPFTILYNQLKEIK